MLVSTIMTAASSVRTDGTYAPFSMDAWGYAGQMTLLGMLMIFSVLGLLWGVLAIFKLVFVRKPKRTNTVKPPVQIPISEPATVEQTAPSESDDSELVAIITAAVAAYIADSGEEMPSGGFRVVSFKRERGGRAWNSK